METGPSERPNTFATQCDCVYRNPSTPKLNIAQSRRFVGKYRNSIKLFLPVDVYLRTAFLLDFTQCATFGGDFLLSRPNFRAKLRTPRNSAEVMRRKNDEDNAHRVATMRQKSEIASRNRRGRGGSDELVLKSEMCVMAGNPYATS